MAGLRKQYRSEFKVRGALEAIKVQKTANEIASEYGVHPTQIAQWKKQALDELLMSLHAQDQSEQRARKR